MEEIPMNEQWKLNGDCEICRRAKYCTKGCKKQRTADERLMKALAFRVFTRAIFNPKRVIDKEGAEK